MAIKLTDQNFEEEVLNNEDPVLVDFWAPWCGPCKMLSPVIDKLSEIYDDRAVKIGKLNVDKNKETASNYDVSGIPTLIFFKDGEPVEKTVGAKSLDELKGLINDYL